MGLSGFLSFLRKKHPDLLIEESIAYVAHQRVFIDISGYIYRYLCTFGRKDDRWIGAILQLFSTFREHRVIPIPVFDGKPPVEKDLEINERREKRSALQDRIHELESALGGYPNDPESIPILQKELDRLETSGKRMVSLLHRPASNRISSSDLQLLRATLQTLQNQHVVITDEDRFLLKQIFTACGISWLQSSSESEAYCAYLTRQGLGAAVVSADSDCLAHLASDWILEVTPQGRCTHIRLQDALHALELTPEQLIDYAILMGCDYNKHVKSHKLGPVTALKLIQEHQSIESIPDTLINKECLHYARCRELFQHPFETVVISYTPPNVEAIQVLTDIRKWPPSFCSRVIRPVSSLPICIHDAEELPEE